MTGVKYEVSISYNAKIVAKVKRQQTDRQTGQKQLDLKKSKQNKQKTPPQ